jgi:hypothetical protein
MAMTELRQLGDVQGCSLEFERDASLRATHVYATCVLCGANVSNRKDGTAATVTDTAVEYSTPNAIRGVLAERIALFGHACQGRN